MRRITIGTAIGLLCLLTPPALAQNATLDALRQAAEQQSEQGNTEAAIQQYVDLIKQSLAVGRGLRLAEDFNRLGELYERLGTIETTYRGLSARQEAAQIYEAEGEFRAAAQTWEQMAVNAGAIAQYVLETDYRGQAIALYARVGDRAKVSELAFAQGQSLGFSETPERAFPYLDQAITAAVAIDAPRLPEMLRFAGTIALQNNRLEQSFAWYDQLLDYHEEQNEWVAYAEQSLRVGRAQREKGDPRESLRYFQGAAEGFRRAGRDADALAAYQRIGEYYLAAEDLPQALATYEAAVQLAEQFGSPTDTAWLLYEVGQLYRRLQQPQTSVDYYNRALRLYQATPAGGWATHNTTQDQVDNLIAETLKQLQAVYETLLDDPEAALRVAQEQVALRERGNNPEELKHALIRLARSYDRLGQRAEAIATYERLVEMRNQDRENLEDYGFLTSDLAQLYDAVGRTADAIAHLERTVELYRQAGDERDLARILATLGDFAYQIGDRQRQQAAYTEAMAIAERNNYPFIQIILNLRRADLRYDQQDDAGALALLETNVAIAKQQSNVRTQADTLQQLSYFYSPWNSPRIVDLDAAFRYQTQARRVLEAANELDELAESFIWSGDLAEYEERPDVALRYYQQAIAVYERGDRSLTDQADVWLRMGRLTLSQGQPQQALAYFEQSVTHDLRQSWAVLKYQGDAYRQLGQLDRALDLYERSLLVSNTRSLITASGNLIWYRYLDTWTAIAQVQRDRGAYPEALAQIRKVIREVETYSRQLKDPQARQGFFTSVQDYYDTYIDLLMRLHQQEPEAGYDVQALQADENRRTQGLLGMLTEANVDLRQGVDPALLARETQLLEKIEALETERIAALAQAADAANLETERDRLLEQYETLKDQIRAANPQYAQVQYPQPLNLGEIQQLLDTDTVLLQYALGEQQSHLWVVSQQDLQSYTLPPRAELEKLARTFNRRLQSGSSPERLQSTALELSQPLLAPLGESLQGKRLLIVSDGALQYIPFAALTQPGSDRYDPLIHHHEIVTLPSISTLATLRQTAGDRRQPSQKLAILADPVFTPQDERVAQSGGLQEKVLANLQVSRAATDVGIAWSRLPGTRREAQAILELIPEQQATAHFGFDATKAIAFTPDLAEAQYVHFATHGFVNTQKPELSGIVMSLLDDQGQPQNGFLRLNDVYNLDLAAELVVLSACETGTGTLVRGEGLIGLTRGFMYAGAERVVASLWQVDDAATAALMSEFYRQLLEEDATPAEALRAAQQAIAAQPQWAAPYYWAAFTLQGDW